MINFRQTIVNRIKSASDEREVEKVIDDSLTRLRIKNVNGHIIQRFISGMGLALHREIACTPPPKILENINLALNLYKKLQKPLSNLYE